MMHGQKNINLTSVYFVIQSLYVSGIFVTHHQEVYCTYTTNELRWNWFHLNPAIRKSTEKHNTYQLLYIYSIPPDDGLQIFPKHADAD
jgi:hypothetical protein